MGQILLVRHGQASWGAADYDVLSPRGEEQAAVLGEFLAHLEPGVVLHGTLQRQRRTAEIAAAAAGWDLSPVTDERWNEMDHLALLARHPQPFEGEPDRQQFQAWFEAATGRWTAGHHDHEYDESFPAFTRRVHAALGDAYRASAGAGTVVVVTSGGPVAAVATELLGAGASTYQVLAPVVINTSVTRIVTGQRGRTLVSFNEAGHLEGRRELLTYR